MDVEEPSQVAAMFSCGSGHGQVQGCGGHGSLGGQSGASRGGGL